MRIGRRLGAAVIVLVAGVTGCGPTDVADVDPARAFVDLELTDGSVAPSAHRSWTLLMDDELVLTTVSDYDEVLFEQQARTPSGAWARLLDRVGPVLERARDAGDDDCGGGATLRVRTYEAQDADDVGRGGSEVLDEVVVTSCSAAGREAIEELETLVAPLATLVELPEQASSWPTSAAG